MNAKLFTITGAGVALLSAASALLNYLPLAGIALTLASSVTVLTFLAKAFIDNKKTQICKANWFRVASLTVIVWGPVALVLAPGICLSLWIDDLIERGVQYTYGKTIDMIRTYEGQIEERVQEIEKVPLNLWWPRNWFREGERIVERKILKTVQHQVVEPAKFHVRVMFSIMFSLLRVSEYLLYLTIGYSFLRSILFSLSRAALYNRTQITFMLPHG